MKPKALQHIKTTGFKVPEAYFEHMDDAIFNHVKLKTRVTDSGYTVPNTYFEQLDTQILNAVKPKSKVISLFSRKNLIYLSGMAAAILIFIQISTPKEPSNQDIVDYLLEQDIDTYDLATVLNIDTIDIEDDLNPYTDESLEDYIIDDINIEDIIK